METTETLDKLVHTILTDAETEAEKIIAEAEQEKDRIIQEARMEAERREQRILREAEAEAELVKRRELARTGLQIRMEMLETKEKLIEQAIANALEKLEAFTKESGYRALLEQVIVDGAVGLGGGELQVQTNEADAAKLQALQQLEKRVVEQTKTETTLKLAPERLNCIGGALIQKADGSVFIDNTFEARIERQRRETRVLIANALFDE
jgi:V/A-type H+-transporting ATPase subunit E